MHEEIGTEDEELRLKRERTQVTEYPTQDFVARLEAKFDARGSEEVDYSQ